MAIPETGPISFLDIIEELDGTRTARPISLNDPEVRMLADKPSGKIAFSDLLGKSKLLPLPIKHLKLPIGLGAAMSGTLTHLGVGTDGVPCLAGFNNGKVAWSRNGGTKWEAISVNTYSTGTAVKDLEVGAYGSVMFFENGNGVLFHHTSQTLTALGNPLASGLPTNDKIFYLCGDGESTFMVGYHGGYAAISYDNGNTWKALPRWLNSGSSSTVGGVTSIVTDRKGTWMVCFSSGHIAVSRDDGYVWGASPLNNRSGGLQSVTHAGTNGKGVWIFGQSTGHCFRSSDDGNTAKDLPKFLGMPTPTWSNQLGKGIVANNDGVWMTFATNYVAKSLDNGVTWHTLPRDITLNTNNVQGYPTAIATDGSDMFMVANQLGGITRLGILETLPDYFGKVTQNTAGAVFAIATNSRTTWVCVINDGLVYQSVNNGRTWTQVYNLNYPSAQRMSVRIDVNPNTGTWIIGTSYGKFIRSTDGGTTWTALSNFLGISNPPSYASMRLKYGNLNDWLVTFGSDIVMHSIDDGATWSKVNTTNYLSDDPSVLSAGSHGVSCTWVVATTNGKGARRSTDYGKTWITIDPFLGMDYKSGYWEPTSITTDNKGVWIAKSNTSLHSRSFDDGVTWEPIGAGLNMGGTTTSKSAILTDGDGLWLSVSYNGRSAYSRDNGTTWTRLSPITTWDRLSSLGSVYGAAMQKGGFAIVGHVLGRVMKFSLWDYQEGNLYSGSTSVYYGVNFLVAGRDGVWVAAMDDGKFIRSTDNGLSWGTLPINLGGDSYQSLSSTGGFCTDDNGMLIFVGSYGFFSRSTDNGATWTTTKPWNGGGNTDFSGHLRCVATDKKGVVIVGGTGISRSTDNGATWTKLPKNLNTSTTGSIADIATDENGVWVAYFENGIAARSTDNGATWTQVNIPANYGYGIASIATNKKGLWLLCTDSHLIYRSTDNGATWTKLPKSLMDFNHNNIFDAAAVLNSAMVTDGKGTWMIGLSTGYTVSKNNGETWELKRMETRSLRIATDGKGTWIAGARSGVKTDGGVFRMSLLY